jgi:hypothetical protein
VFVQDLNATLAVDVCRRDVFDDQLKNVRATTDLRASALATRSTDPTARTVVAELERQAAITKLGAEAELHAAVKTLLRCGVSVHVAP